MSVQESGVAGKVVVITGASSGIGEATARLLTRHGARLVVGARRVERLEALVSGIRAAGGTAEYQTVDVTKREQVEALVDRARRTYGRVDVVVNNAGIMPLSTLEQLKVDEWDRTKKRFDEFRAIAIPADAIARAILFAIEQPDNVDVSEMIVQPTGEQ